MKNFHSNKIKTQLQYTHIILDNDIFYHLKQDDIKTDTYIITNTILLYNRYKSFYSLNILKLSPDPEKVLKYY
jgi:hypothetical protein